MVFSVVAVLGHPHLSSSMRLFLPILICAVHFLTVSYEEAVSPYKATISARMSFRAIPLLWGYMITPRCQSLSNLTKKVLVLLFKIQNFKVIADKSECIKVKSFYKCLDLMHTKFHGSVAPASRSGSELFILSS